MYDEFGNYYPDEADSAADVGGFWGGLNRAIQTGASIFATTQRNTNATTATVKSNEKTTKMIIIGVAALAAIGLLAFLFRSGK